MSTSHTDISERIRRKQAKVGIIGLGYVGLPLAVEFARAGFDVTGFDVDNAKKLAREELERTGSLPTLSPDELRQRARPGDYVAILAYLDRTSETEAAVEQARMAIRDRYKVATTTGFGPRFLHSTGQLHKGGANNGVFMQITDGARPKDLPIPGQEFTFGTLIDAQALGDLRSLRSRGRRVARVRLDQLMEVI